MPPHNTNNGLLKAAASMLQLSAQNSISNRTALTHVCRVCTEDMLLWASNKGHMERMPPMSQHAHSTQPPSAPIAPRHAHPPNNDASLELPAIPSSLQAASPLLSNAYPPALFPSTQAAHPYPMSSSSEACTVLVPSMQLRTRPPWPVAQDMRKDGGCLCGAPLAASLLQIAAVGQRSCFPATPPSTSLASCRGFSIYSPSSASGTGCESSTFNRSPSNGSSAFSSNHISIKSNSSGSTSSALQLKKDGSSSGGVDVAQQLAHIISALRTLREAEELLVSQRNQFRAEHVAQLLAKLPDLDLEVANAHIRIGQLIKVTGDALCKTRAVLHGPELAGCIIAYARLHASPPGGVVPLLQELSARSGKKMQQCSGNDLCTLGWALVRLQGMYGDALQLAALEFLPELQQASPQQQQQQQQQLPGAPSAPIMHAQKPDQSGFAMDGTTLPLTWRTLSHAVHRKLNQTTGDDVAKLAWAMAKVQHLDITLLDAMAQRVTTICGAILPMEHQDPAASGERLMSKLAHLSFGQRQVALKALQQKKREIRVKEMAALRAAHKTAVKEGLIQPSKGTLLLGRGSQMVPLLLTGSAQDRGTEAGAETKHVHAQNLVPSPSGIANLAWAFLTLGQRAPSMLAALARAAVVQKADFTPSTLSTVLWAYAACSYYDRVMCNTLGRRAALSLKRMPLHEVTQVCWSLATLRHHEPLLTLRLSHALADRLAPQQPSSTAKSISDADSLGDVDDASAVPLHLPEPLSPPQAVTLLWSLAHMPPVSPHSAGNAASSGLAPASRQAHTQAASLLCRELSSPGVIDSLIPRDCVRALWSIAVLGILPGEDEGIVSNKEACRALAPPLLKKLRLLTPQDLAQEQLTMLHAAALVIGQWGSVRANGDEHGTQQGHVINMGGLVRAEQHQVDEGDTQGQLYESWEQVISDSDDSDFDEGQEQHAQRDHLAYARWQEQQQQGQQACQDLGTDLADSSGIIDISHVRPAVPPHPRPSRAAPHTHCALHAEGSSQVHEQVEGARCLPELLRVAARAAVLDGAAERFRDRKAGLWEHEAHRVAEALGLIQLSAITAVLPSSQSGTYSSDNTSDASTSSTGPIGRAQEQAGNGLAAYADAKGMLVAVLREGQAHHTRSMPFLPLGSTLLARHALERSGWTVAVLPWYEWATLQSFEDQIVYLGGKCVEAGVNLP